MVKVKIYGAGSIGNHLAYGCRNKGWDVAICDIDPKALERTKNDIYPSRYGRWDDNIRLASLDEIKGERFDAVIIGTPPDTHIKLALEELKSPPKVLLIEKPLCTPSLDGCAELYDLAKKKGAAVKVGYNHTLTENTRIAYRIIKEGAIGEPLALSALFREHWGGIFAAHPWLSGPGDSYLGFCGRGGGASGEHSHAVNIWQYFSHIAGMGRITEVSAMLDMVDDGKAKYDRICQINVRTEKGLTGSIIQDVVTEPHQKMLRIQGREGAVEWHVNMERNRDAVVFFRGGKEAERKLIEKTRPDDFKGEIEDIERSLENKCTDSPISLERGLETMLVLAACHLSHERGKTAAIDYSKGYTAKALR